MEKEDQRDGVGWQYGEDQQKISYWQGYNRPKMYTEGYRITLLM